MHTCLVSEHNAKRFLHDCFIFPKINYHQLFSPLFFFFPPSKPFFKHQICRMIFKNIFGANLKFFFRDKNRFFLIFEKPNIKLGKTDSFNKIPKGSLSHQEYFYFGASISL